MYSDRLCRLRRGVAAVKPAVRKRAAGAVAALAVCLAAAVPAFAHEGADGPATRVAELTGHAELVFQGTVTGIVYRASQAVVLTDDAGSPVLDEEGQPVLQDGSEVPHTFVTYRIERIFKGRTAGNEITLRFFGGLADEPWVETDELGNTITAPMAVWSSLTPRFDVGDRDILFVEGNGDHDCPLVRCATGRVRLLDTAGTGRARVYTDDGQQLLRARVAPRTIEAVPGLYEAALEVMTHTITEGLVVETEDIYDVDPTEDPSTFVGPPRGPHFTERRFGALLRKLIGRGSSTAPLTESADPAQPFIARAAFDEAPPPEPPAAPAIAAAAPRTAQQIAEEEALAANGGNPVLPTVR